MRTVWQLSLFDQTMFAYFDFFLSLFIVIQVPKLSFESIGSFWLTYSCVVQCEITVKWQIQNSNSYFCEFVFYALCIENTCYSSSPARIYNIFSCTVIYTTRLMTVNKSFKSYPKPAELSKRFHWCLSVFALAFLISVVSCLACGFQFI